MSLMATFWGINFPLFSHDSLSVSDSNEKSIESHLRILVSDWIVSEAGIDSRSRSKFSLLVGCDAMAILLQCSAAI